MSKILHPNNNNEEKTFLSFTTYLAADAANKRECFLVANDQRTPAVLREAFLEMEERWRASLISV